MICLLAFTLFCTMMSKTELIAENAVQIETYKTEVTDELAAEEEEETVSARYFGNCRITFYCPGACCCGQWASGATASGTVATANRTVANGSLPFGTRVLIDGQEYIVEDRGVGSNQFDIFVNSHQEALDRGLYYTDVYIIDG